NDTMRMLANGASDSFTRLSVSTGELRIETAGTIAAAPPADTPHQLSIAFGFNSSRYYYCQFYDPGGFVAISKYDGANYTGVTSTPYTAPLPTGAFGMRIDESVSAQSVSLQATVGG